MILIDKIIENTSLKIVDGNTSRKFILKDMFYDLSFMETSDKQLVFLYCQNQVHSVGMYFSFLRANVVLVLLNEALGISLKKALERNYQPNIIVDITREAIEGHEKCTMSSSFDTVPVFISKEKHSHRINENIKLMLPTSGTTGSPKLVKLSEKNLYENAVSISDYLPIISQDVTPLNLPIYYSYGLSVLHSNALNGGTIVCHTDDILSKEFWNQFVRFEFTSIAGVPFVYEMLDRIGFRKKHYTSLRYISQAGGNLNQRTKQRFLDYATHNNIDFYVMYGQTEATARIAYVCPNKLQNKLTSIGKPISKGSLSIDQETKELLYEGPNIFGGYAKTQTDLAVWEQIKPLRTGDLAQKDEDGYYFIIGRIKRFIKIFGNRINLDELEQFLKEQTEDTDFACIGLADKDIVVFTNKTIQFERFRKNISDTFKIHKSVLKHEVIGNFPLTTNKKLDYQALEKICEP